MSNRWSFFYIFVPIDIVWHELNDRFIDFESTQKWSSLPFIVSVIFLRMAASREAVNFRIAYRISSAESLIDTLLTQQIKGIRCQCQWIQKLY